MLSIVRHGRTDANRSGLLLGRLDVGLDAFGEAQARALAEVLGPVDRVVSSPLRRTRQTAQALGEPVEIDERWIELDYGEFDGTPISAVPTNTWRRWRSDVDFAPPGGESLRSLGTRVREACESLRSDAAQRHVVVVTHVSPVKAAAAWAMGVGDEVAWRMFVAPASITTIAVGERGPSLHGFNAISHLSALVD